MNEEFHFKKMIVWQKAMTFACLVIDITENLNSSKNHFKLIEQIEGAAASVPQNIAEGKGRSSKKDYCKFLTYSRGSLYEAITILNIFFNKEWINKETLDKLENLGTEIAKMLNAIIRKLENSNNE